MTDFKARDRPKKTAERRRADLRPDYSRQQAARQSAGWMMPQAADPKGLL
jgi:hypothetical protein